MYFPFLYLDQILIYFDIHMVHKNTNFVTFVLYTHKQL